MIDELKRLKPRARADVEVRLQRQDMASTLILRRLGAEPIPLTAIGYFAFLQMDGETPLGEIARRIDQRFEGAGVDLHHLVRLVEQLQASELLFEDQRVVRARAALERAGIRARNGSGDVSDQPQNRHNDDVSALVHAGFASLVGSEFTRALRKFRAASEAMPRSLRLARLIDVLERVGAGEVDIERDPWVGIEHMVSQAIDQRVCPACGGHLREVAARAYRCEDCGGEFQR